MIVSFRYLFSDAVEDDMFDLMMVVVVLEKNF